MTQVLAVDDTPLNLKLLSVMLVSHGYEVRTATTAEEALEVLVDYRPKLLLVDVRLPKLDGLGLVRLVRADPAHRSLVIVAVTASAMKGDEQVALAAGCDAYVTKPIDTRTLPVRLARLLAGS
ncbi:MAG: response regulator [Kofleriaceae bacterium]